MKTTITRIAAFCASAALVAGLCGCSGGSVAATVNGTPIYEDEVTSYITMMRSSYGLDDDSDWASYISMYGYTAEDIREQTIDSMAQQLLIEQVAEENGITVDESEIDSAIENVKAYYSSDEEFEEALESSGMTEEDLRENYRQYYIQQDVMEAVITVTLSDEDIQTYLNEDASTYEGAKRSSHILVDDEETANQIIQEINAGKDFAEAAAEYSTDSSASSGGDVGWDCESSFVTAYQDALDALAVGEMTQTPVESDYGFHIILCTDICEIQYDGDNVVASSLPEDLYEDFLSTAESEKQSDEFSDYVNNLLAEADIQINDMPSGLPYDVEVTDDTTTDSTSTDATSTDTTTDSTSTDASSDSSTEGTE